jgi:hypothetical protein
MSSMSATAIGRWSFASLLLAVSTIAVGQECEPYTAASFTADLDSLTPLFEAVDLEGAGATLVGIEASLLCLDVVAPRVDFARFARGKATVGFLRQDEDIALRWGRSAKFADVDGAWPSIIPPGHPVTSLPDDVGPPLWGGPTDQEFAGDRGDAYFANGTSLTTPRLASEVPFLIQRFDKRERLVSSIWQDGAAFDDAMLVDGDKAFEAPDWFDAAGAEPVGLGEAETFSMAIDTGEGTDIDPDIPDEPEIMAPVDDRPIEVRARESYERAIGIADLNESQGREKLTDFMDDFGDSGIPEIADAQRWLERPPSDEPELELELELEPVQVVVDTPPAVVDVPDRPPRERVPRERTPRTGKGSNTLRTVSYILGGSAVAMYGGAMGTRAAYNSNPSDGTYYATNGLTLASTGAGAAAAGLFVTSFLVGGGE